MDGSSTFLLLVVIGLFAYGRALRSGIISGLSAHGSLPVTGAPDTNAVQGALPGSADSIPNSNGFSLPDSAPFYETGGSPTTASGKPGLPFHNPFAVHPIYPIFGGVPVDGGGDSGGSGGSVTSTGTGTGKPGIGSGPSGFNSPIRAL